MTRLRPVGAFAWAVASVVLAAALYGGYRAVPGLSPFVLESIRVEGAVRTDPGAVLQAAGLEPGTGLFQIDVGRTRRAVETLPWVRRCRVVRQIPSTLTVEVEEWAPRYLVRMDRLYYLTREGHAIRAELGQGLDYPVVTGLTWADLERDAPLRRSLLELFGVLERGLLGGEASEIHADPGAGLTVYAVSGGATGIHLGFAPYEEKLDRLARLRRHLGRRGQEAASVNLAHADKVFARLAPAEGKRAKP